MRVLDISYSVFKQVCADLQVYYSVQTDGVVALTVSNADLIAVARAASAEEIEDFEEHLQPEAIQVASEDEAVAKAAFSDSRLQVNPRTATKVQPFATPGREYQVVGKRLAAALDGSSTLDISFPEEREVQGASAFVLNPTDGDYMDFFAVLPGNPEQILLHWGVTIYAKPNVVQEFRSEDARTIPAGIVLRLVYTSVGTEGPPPTAYIDLVTWK